MTISINHNTKVKCDLIDLILLLESSRVLLNFYLSRKKKNMRIVPSNGGGGLMDEYKSVLHFNIILLIRNNTMNHCIKLKNKYAGKAQSFIILNMN